ncbi:MAG: hypothetical protein WC966_11915 [Bradymonadales bacterium]
MPKYLVKTANFVAQIDDDEQLVQLAAVDTLKKKSLVRQLPDGEWKSADQFAILRRIWGLAGDAPQAPPPVPPKVGKRDVPSAAPPSLETTVDYAPHFFETTDHDDVALAVDFDEAEPQFLSPRELLSSDGLEYSAPSDQTKILPSELVELEAVQELSHEDIKLELDLGRQEEAEAMQILDDLAIEVAKPLQSQSTTLPLLDVDIDELIKEERDSVPEAVTKDFKQAAQKLDFPELKLDFADEDETAALKPQLKQASLNAEVSPLESASGEAAPNSLDAFLQNEDFSTWIANAATAASSKLENVSTREYRVKKAEDVHDFPIVIGTNVDFEEQRTSDLAAVYSKTKEFKKLGKKKNTKRISSKKIAKEASIILSFDDDEDSHSDRFKTHSVAQIKSNNVKLAQDLDELDIFELDFNDDNPSEKLRVHSRSELLRFAQAQEEALENESSIEIDEEYSSDSMQPHSRKELRNLFESQDELHLFLASEIQSSDIPATNDSDNSPVQIISRDDLPKHTPTESEKNTSRLNKKVQELVASRAEPTAIIPQQREKGQSYSSVFDLNERLASNEIEIARFKTLGITNLRLWNLNTRSGLYESYNLNKISWIALRKLRSRVWLILTIVAILSSLLAFAVLKSNVMLIISAYVFILGLVLYFATAYNTIDIGLNGSRIRLGIKIKKEDVQQAIAFLDQLDKARFNDEN